MFFFTAQCQEYISQKTFLNERQVLEILPYLSDIELMVCYITTEISLIMKDCRAAEKRMEEIAVSESVVS